MDAASPSRPLPCLSFSILCAGLIPRAANTVIVGRTNKGYFQTSLFAASSVTFAAITLTQTQGEVLPWAHCSHFLRHRPFFLAAPAWLKSGCVGDSDSFGPLASRLPKMKLPHTSASHTAHPLDGNISGRLE